MKLLFVLLSFALALVSSAAEAKVVLRRLHYEAKVRIAKRE